MGSWLENVVSRRQMTGLLGLSVVFTLFPSLAVAAGPKLKARKVGQKIIFRGYTYTVVKLKGKLVWKQGEKVAAATASPTPTPVADTTSVTKGVVIAQSTQILEGATKLIDAKDNDGRDQKFAISRSNGQVRVMSSICTHAGCIVGANGANLRCACHGSVFSGVDGAVQQGPATLALRVYQSLEEKGEIILLK